jgi:hypothetical protein
MTASISDLPQGAVHPVLWTMATDWPIPVLGARVLGMRAGGMEDRSAVNATIVVEVAAEHRSPAELAELVAEFDSAADDLARLALDAAAARRTTETLADLAGGLVAHGLPERADMLLEAVVRRRLPRETAGLLADLDGSRQTSLAAKLVADLAEEDDGKVFVVLWLAALGSPGLAERYSRHIADILQPAGLARFIRGLRAYQDAPSAEAAVKSALGRDLGQVAELIGHLGGNDDEEHSDTTEAYATGLVTEALEILEPEDLIVLASLLQDGWQYGARIIWNRIVPDMEDARLIDALSGSKVMTPRVHEALRTAAETHPAERVAVIALDVEGKIAGGKQIVLQTVGASRSIADIFGMAEELDNRGYGGMAHEFLVQVAEVVHKRKNGGEVAEFIDRLLSRPAVETGRRLRRPENPQRRRIQPILKRVAAERAPEQLMGMIAELTIRHRYNSCRGDVEREVAEHYGAAQLAALPLVRGRDYLLAVLEIELKAFDTPRGAAPEDIPRIIQALQKVRTPDEKLYSMLAYTGGVRPLDYHEIILALRKRDMTAEADWVRHGHSRHPPRPHFIT